MRYVVNLATGETEELPDLPVEPAPPPSVEEYKQAIEQLLDLTARERRYDSSVSIATYINSTNATWAFEATAFVEWRDDVWTYAYAELDKVLTGLRPQPTVAELLAELPVMQWPE
ncbi:hypothetical protein [Aminobacter phage Erebus]|nr:hypothetical protein [Aminobacter phage Erebus]